MIQDILDRFLPKVFLGRQRWYSHSSRKLVRSGLCIAGGAIVGTISWSGNPLLIPTATLFPVLWAYSPSRIIAGLVAGAYFLSASSGLPQGVRTFFGAQLAIGLTLWVVASLGFVIVHTTLWTGSRGGHQRPLRYLLAAILMSIPPFGIVGWANPVTAAGILFPKWGWFGILSMAVLLGAATTQYWKSAISLVIGLSIWSIVFWSEPAAPEEWAGIDTSFQFDKYGRYGGYAQHIETIARVREAVRSGTKVVVLPESAFGVWTPTTQRLWERALEGLKVRVIGGAEMLDAHGYDSVLIEIEQDENNNTVHVLYRERMPVPVSMWQPWTTLFGNEQGAHAHFLGKPVATVGNLRIAPLICYEQLIVWPVLHAMLFRPDVIVAPANGWWTSGTSIIAIQKASSQAWASLFGVPLVSAFNR